MAARVTPPLPREPSAHCAQQGRERPQAWRGAQTVAQALLRQPTCLGENDWLLAVSRVLKAQGLALDLDQDSGAWGDLAQCLFW